MVFAERSNHTPRCSYPSFADVRAACFGARPSKRSLHKMCCGVRRYHVATLAGRIDTAAWLLEKQGVAPSAIASESTPPDQLARRPTNRSPATEVSPFRAFMYAAVAAVWAVPLLRAVWSAFDVHCTSSVCGAALTLSSCAVVAVASASSAAMAVFVQRCARLPSTPCESMANDPRSCPRATQRVLRQLWHLAVALLLVAPLGLVVFYYLL